MEVFALVRAAAAALMLSAVAATEEGATDGDTASRVCRLDFEGLKQPRCPVQPAGNRR